MKQYYEEACSRLDVENEQEEEDKVGSDDEVCIGGSHAAASNAACPLSGKSVRPLHVQCCFSCHIMLTICQHLAPVIFQYMFAAC